MSKTLGQLKDEVKQKQEQHQRLKLQLRLRDLNRRVAELELLTLGDSILEDNKNE